VDADEDIPSPRLDKGKAKARDDDTPSATRVSDNSMEYDSDTLRYPEDGNSPQTAITVDSDDEPDLPGERDVIFGRVKKEATAPEQVEPLSKFLPSSKMKYMMEQLEDLGRLKPNEKVLVVSQWTSCLSLVSAYLTEKHIPHVKYQGDMTPTKREQAVQVFMSKEKARVMLMSLKCGGVGLNLTRANNVISLDLGWSPAVESQAFDRVHRVGQTKNVLVQRIVIAGTVEDRILEMQQRKQTLADGSLGEGSGKKIGKLSVRELANLFGLDRQGRRLGH
jgi:SNF2 family DNA or RNA helicase